MNVYNNSDGDTSAFVHVSSTLQLRQHCTFTSSFGGAHYHHQQKHHHPYYQLAPLKKRRPFKPTTNTKLSPIQCNNNFNLNFNFNFRRPTTPSTSTATSTSTSTSPKTIPKPNRPLSYRVDRRKFLILALTGFTSLFLPSLPSTNSSAATASSLEPLLERDVQPEGLQMGKDGSPFIPESLFGAEDAGLMSTRIESHATYEDYIHATKIPPIDYDNLMRSYFNLFLLISIPSSIFYTFTFVSFRNSPRITLPIQYDRYALQRYFYLHPELVIQRLFQIVYHSSSLILHMIKDRVVNAFDKSEQGKSKRKVEFAKILKNKIIKLGPAMIKLGQTISTRPDLISKEIANELQPLQDDISQSKFPINEAFEFIEKELGTPIDLLFDEINKVPITYSSLGMVFKGKLDDQYVAIKIQRPQVIKIIALDCFIIRNVTEWITNLFQFKTNWTLFVDEYSSRLFEELDYMNELKNLTTFRQLYDNKYSNIYLPKPFPKYSSTHVLITEWVDGVKICSSTTSPNTDVEEDLNLIIIGIKFSLVQLLDCGFLHADMHNGNILKTKSGFLAYIDFGIVSEIPIDLRQSITCALVYLLHDEYGLLAETFSSLELMKSNDVEVELPLLTESLRELFSESSMQGFETGNKNFTLIGIISKLLSLSTKFPLVFSDYIINNLRCLSMLEGLALNLDSNFNIFNIIYPFIINKLLTGESKRYRTALQKLVIDCYGRLRWNRIEQILYNLYQIEHKYDTDKKVVNKSVLVLQFMFRHEEGKFLRDYMIQSYFNTVQLHWKNVVDDVFDINHVNDNKVIVQTIIDENEMMTERELSDDETTTKTKQFFKYTNNLTKLKLFAKLMPKAVVPAFQSLFQIIVYAVSVWWSTVVVRMLKSITKNGKKKSMANVSKQQQQQRQQQQQQVQDSQSTSGVQQQQRQGQGIAAVTVASGAVAVASMNGNTNSNISGSMSSSSSSSSSSSRSSINNASEHNGVAYGNGVHMTEDDAVGAKQEIEEQESDGARSDGVGERDETMSDWRLLDSSFIQRTRSASYTRVKRMS